MDNIMIMDVKIYLQYLHNIIIVFRLIVIKYVNNVHQVIYQIIFVVKIIFILIFKLRCAQILFL